MKPTRLLIHSRFISKDEMTLLERKGFKKVETNEIPCGLYEGNVYVVSLPENANIYPTTEQNTFCVIHNGRHILSIIYNYYKNAGMVFINKKDAYWK